MKGLILDHRICRRLNGWTRSGGICLVFALISRAGDRYIWPAMVAGYLLTGSQAGLETAWRMTLAMALGLLIYRIVKMRFRRGRPFAQHPDITARGIALDEYSFPSGHTMHTVSFAVIGVVHFPALSLPLALFALMTAVSRIVLGLHYLTDVLAGAAVGYLIALAVLAI